MNSEGLGRILHGLQLMQYACCTAVTPLRLCRKRCIARFGRDTIVVFCLLMRIIWFPQWYDSLDTIPIRYLLQLALQTIAKQWTLKLQRDV